MFEAWQYPKLAMRASRDLLVGRGGHTAPGLAGDAGDTSAITILHAPLRARACLRRKAEHGERLEQVGVEGLDGWQVRQFAAWAREGTLDASWQAHAYDADGTLQVGARRVPLIRDDRLASVLRPWVRAPAKQLLARALRRTY
jgi:hypothetical protein